MEFFAKTFDELTTKELYEILKSRSQIFTIEQNIHCQDMDDIVIILYTAILWMIIKWLLI